MKSIASARTALVGVLASSLFLLVLVLPGAAYLQPVAENWGLSAPDEDHVVAVKASGEGWKPLNPEPESISLWTEIPSVIAEFTTGEGEEAETVAAGVFPTRVIILTVPEDMELVGGEAFYTQVDGKIAKVVAPGEGPIGAGTKLAVPAPPMPRVPPHVHLPLLPLMPVYPAYPPMSQPSRQEEGRVKMWNELYYAAHMSNLGSEWDALIQAGVIRESLDTGDFRENGIGVGIASDGNDVYRILFFDKHLYDDAVEAVPNDNVLAYLSSTEDSVSVVFNYFRTQLKIKQEEDNDDNDVELLISPKGEQSVTVILAEGAEKKGETSIAKLEADMYGRIVFDETDTELTATLSTNNEDGERNGAGRARGEGRIAMDNRRMMQNINHPGMSNMQMPAMPNMQMQNQGGHYMQNPGMPNMQARHMPNMQGHPGMQMQDGMPNIHPGMPGMQRRMQEAGMPNMQAHMQAQAHHAHHGMPNMQNMHPGMHMQGHPPNMQAHPGGVPGIPHMQNQGGHYMRGMPQGV